MPKRPSSAASRASSAHKRRQGKASASALENFIKFGDKIRLNVDGFLKPTVICAGGYEIDVFMSCYGDCGCRWVPVGVLCMCYSGYIWNNASKSHLKHSNPQPQKPYFRFINNSVYAEEFGNRAVNGRTVSGNHKPFTTRFVDSQLRFCDALTHYNSSAHHVDECDVLVSMTMNRIIAVTNRHNVTSDIARVVKQATDHIFEFALIYSRNGTCI